MTVQYFTLFHTLISLIGIVTGFGFLAGLFFGKLFPKWTAIFLLTTAATSITGFLFPFNGITPGIIVGIISVAALAVAAYALYGKGLVGWWRGVFVTTSLLSLYFNCFVLIAQLFRRIPALAELAPTQAEPAFAITQLALLVGFVILIYTALRRFRNE